MVFHIIESGSNSMSTYQAIQSAAKSPNDALSLFQNGSSLIATVSNVAPMLQPIRIMTNGLAATSALMRIVTDWQDPNKKVQPGDVLTLVSAAGTVAITLLVWAEIGPGAAAAIGAVALAADLQTNFQPYMSSAKAWMGNLLSNTLQLSSPASVASSSLYWGSTIPGQGWNLYSYDELMSANGLFVCMTDDQTTGTMLRISGSPIPGSFTPIDESSYKQNYCSYLQQQEGWSDIESGMMYCMGSRFR
jgi:hypothetical protein